MSVTILSTGSRPLLVSKSTKARLPIKGRLPDRHGVQALSRCQQRIIVLVAQGLKNCEIAKEIGISVNVVKNYLQTIYDRIGMSNRVELALWYEARVHEGSSLLLSYVDGPGSLTRPRAESPSDVPDCFIQLRMLLHSHWTTLRPGSW
jgi:DNA-binding CsgD family transcriptional regulator